MKGVLEAKGLRKNVKNIKMMVSNEKTGEVETKGRFLVQFAEIM